MPCQPYLTASHASAVKHWLGAGNRGFSAYEFELFSGSKPYLASEISSVFYSKCIALRSSGSAFCGPLILAVKSIKRIGHEESTYFYRFGATLPTFALQANAETYSAQHEKVKNLFQSKEEKL